jgi:hypothetical protein
MSERRYTDEEVAAIFRQAAETEPSAPPVITEGKGLTLAALQDIGREVGLSAESISQAARSLEMAGRPASRTFMGLPIGVGRTVELDRPLSDADWERLVGDLRETFQARGNVKYDGPFRQWTNGNLQALVEPTPTGHRIRLQTVKGVSRTYMAGGLAVLGGAAATAVVLSVAGSLGVTSSMEGVGFMAALGLGMFTAGALRLPGWARRRRAQFEAVTARLVASSGTPPQRLPNPTRDPPGTK